TAMASALNADYLIFGTGRTERVLWDRFLRTASFRVIEAKSGTIVLAGSAEQLNSHATWVGNKLGCETADELNKKSSK
ncbi:MAG: hypothetical protein JNM27_03510, partial [Leptospirales bacterium]|nr:hypothetical protein [Leptospirales bacterium]